MPAKKGTQPDEKFPLKRTVKQRESLVHTTRLTMGMKTRIIEARRSWARLAGTLKDWERRLPEVEE